jgi:ABC-2 type transport system ATP-binding protein
VFAVALVDIEGLTKIYRHGVRANDGISLSIEAGEVFALLGPNGAGKTTLVRQLLTITRPDSGHITIDGVDVLADPMAARRMCSYQPQGHVPAEGLTPLEAIPLFGRIRGLSATDAEARARRLVDALDLGEWASKRTRELSGGVGRLLAFCLAVVAPGRVVVLDEPTNDVDPRRRRLLWNEVRRLADDGAAVLLVTHNVLEAERASDRLAILDGGRVLASGSPAALKAPLSGVLRLEMMVEPGASLDAPPAPLAVTTRRGNRLTIELPRDAAATAVAFATRLEQQGSIEEFSIGPASLEDAYLSATGAPAALVAAG